MNEKQQIEEMANIMLETSRQESKYNSGNKAYTAFAANTIFKYGCDRLNGATAIYNAGYRKQSEVELRVETTTDDFSNLDLAKERGWHRKKFHCPNCDLLIKIETWDSERMFGCGTVLKTNEMPKFCPNCGSRMKGGEE